MRYFQTPPWPVPSPDEKGRGLGVGLATRPWKTHKPLKKQQVKFNKINQTGIRTPAHLT